MKKVKGVHADRPKLKGIQFTKIFKTKRQKILTSEKLAPENVLNFCYKRLKY